ncbi:MAG: hypothetical protein HEQ23_13870 [Tepidisphaera sp.]|jgi:hypothetical protein
MTTWTDTLRTIAKAADDAAVFGSVRVTGDRLECKARSADAFYRVDVKEDGGACVSLVTPDRWLSQSIEKELVNNGDKFEDLLDEELAELGYRGPAPKIEHYRSDDKLYTFRTPVFPSAARATSPEQARVLIQHLLAYEAMFGVLGDMPGGDEE